MPINKMQYRNIGKDQVDQIAQLTGGTARLAIDLIDYDPKFEPVMRQVFGTTFICDDQEAAKKICYNPRFAFVCVTLQGDKYEPSGGLHGGSVPQGGNILLKIDGFLQSDERCRQKEQELFQQKKELDSLSE